MWPLVQVLIQTWKKRRISNPRLGSGTGLASRNQGASDASAVLNAPSWASVHAMAMARVAGRMRRGARRNALFAMDERAAAGWPARARRKGFNAHTKPVRKAKMATPMRPCQGMRRMGHCSTRGVAPGRSSRGRRRSLSNARARCVQMTMNEAMPRRPCPEVLVRAAERQRRWKSDIHQPT